MAHCHNRGRSKVDPCIALCNTFSSLGFKKASKNCFYEDYVLLRNQLLLLEYDEDDPIVPSKLYEATDMLLRYIEDVPKPIRETVEFVKDVHKKIFFLSGVASRDVRNSRKFPNSRELHFLLVRYVELEYEVLYIQENPSPEYQKQVEKRVLSLLLTILQDSGNWQQRDMLDEEIINEMSAMNTLYIMKRVRDEYKKKGNFIEKIMNKLLRILDMLDDVSVMTNKSETFPVDKLLEVPKVQKLIKYFQQRDYQLEDPDFSEDEIDEMPEEVATPVKKEEVTENEEEEEEVEEKYDISSFASCDTEEKIMTIDLIDEDLSMVYFLPEVQKLNIKDKKSVFDSYISERTISNISDRFDKYIQLNSVTTSTTCDNKQWSSRSAVSSDSLLIIEDSDSDIEILPDTNYSIVNLESDSTISSEQQSPHLKNSKRIEVREHSQSATNSELEDALLQCDDISDNEIANEDEILNKYHEDTDDAVSDESEVTKQSHIRNDNCEEKIISCNKLVREVYDDRLSYRNEMDSVSSFESTSLSYTNDENSLNDRYRTLTENSSICNITPITTTSNSVSSLLSSSFTNNTTEECITDRRNAEISQQTLKEDYFNLHVKNNKSSLAEEIFEINPQTVSVTTANSSFVVATEESFINNTTKEINHQFPTLLSENSNSNSIVNDVPLKHSSKEYAESEMVEQVTKNDQVSVKHKTSNVDSDDKVLAKINSHIQSENEDKCAADINVPCIANEQELEPSKGDDCLLTVEDNKNNKEQSEKLTTQEQNNSINVEEKQISKNKSLKCINKDFKTTDSTENERNISSIVNYENQTYCEDIEEYVGEFNATFPDHNCSNNLDVLASVAAEQEKMENSIEMRRRKYKKRGRKVIKSNNIAEKPKKKTKKSELTAQKNGEIGVVTRRVTRSSSAQLNCTTDAPRDHSKCIPSTFMNLENLVTPTPNRIYNLIPETVIENEESLDEPFTCLVSCENQQTSVDEKNPLFDEDTIEDGISFVCHKKQSNNDEVVISIPDSEKDFPGINYDILEQTEKFVESIDAIHHTCSVSEEANDGFHCKLLGNSGFYESNQIETEKNKIWREVIVDSSTKRNEYAVTHCHTEELVKNDNVITETVEGKDTSVSEISVINNSFISTKLPHNDSEIENSVKTDAKIVCSTVNDVSHEITVNKMQENIHAAGITESLMNEEKTNIVPLDKTDNKDIASFTPKKNKRNRPPTLIMPVKKRQNYGKKNIIINKYETKNVEADKVSNTPKEAVVENTNIDKAIKINEQNHLISALDYSLLKKDDEKCLNNVASLATFDAEKAVSTESATEICNDADSNQNHIIEENNKSDNDSDKIDCLSDNQLQPEKNNKNLQRDSEINQEVEDNLKHSNEINSCGTESVVDSEVTFTANKEIIPYDTELATVRYGIETATVECVTESTEELITSCYTKSATVEYVAELATAEDVTKFVKELADPTVQIIIAHKSAASENVPELTTTEGVTELETCATDSPELQEQINTNYMKSTTRDCVKEIPPVTVEDIIQAEEVPPITVVEEVIKTSEILSLPVEEVTQTKLITVDNVMKPTENSLEEENNSNSITTGYDAKTSATVESNDNKPTTEDCSTEVHELIIEQEINLCNKSVPGDYITEVTIGEDVPVIKGQEHIQELLINEDKHTTCKSKINKEEEHTCENNEVPSPQFLIEEHVHEEVISTEHEIPQKNVEYVSEVFFENDRICDEDNNISLTPPVLEKVLDSHQINNSHNKEGDDDNEFENSQDTRTMPTLEREISLNQRELFSKATEDTCNHNEVFPDDSYPLLAAYEIEAFTEEIVESCTGDAESQTILQSQVSDNSIDLEISKKIVENSLSEQPNSVTTKISEELDKIVANKFEHTSRNDHRDGNRRILTKAALKSFQNPYVHLQKLPDNYDYKRKLSEKPKPARIGEQRSKSQDNTLKRHKRDIRSLSESKHKRRHENLEKSESPKKDGHGKQREHNSQSKKTNTGYFSERDEIKIKEETFKTKTRSSSQKQKDKDVKITDKNKTPRSSSENKIELNPKQTDEKKTTQTKDKFRIDRELQLFSLEDSKITYYDKRKKPETSKRENESKCNNNQITDTKSTKKEEKEKCSQLVVEKNEENKLAAKDSNSRSSSRNDRKSSKYTRDKSEKEDIESQNKYALNSNDDIKSIQNDSTKRSSSRTMSISRSAENVKDDKTDSKEKLKKSDSSSSHKITESDSEKIITDDKTDVKDSKEKLKKSNSSSPHKITESDSEKITGDKTDAKDSKEKLEKSDSSSPHKITESDSEKITGDKTDAKYSKEKLKKSDSSSPHKITESDSEKIITDKINKEEFLPSSKKSSDNKRHRSSRSSSKNSETQKSEYKDLEETLHENKKPRIEKNKENVCLPKSDNDYTKKDAHKKSTSNEVIENNLDLKNAENFETIISKRETRESLRRNSNREKTKIKSNFEENSSLSETELTVNKIDICPLDLSTKLEKNRKISKKRRFSENHTCELELKNLKKSSNKNMTLKDSQLEVNDYKSVIDCGLTDKERHHENKETAIETTTIQELFQNKSMESDTLEIFNSSKEHISLSNSDFTINRNIEESFINKEAIETSRVVKGREPQKNVLENCGSTDNEKIEIVTQNEDPTSENLSKEENESKRSEANVKNIDLPPNCILTETNKIENVTQYDEPKSEYIKEKEPISNLKLSEPCILTDPETIKNQFQGPINKDSGNNKKDEAKSGLESSKNCISTDTEQILIQNEEPNNENTTNKKESKKSVEISEYYSSTDTDKMENLIQKESEIEDVRKEQEKEPKECVLNIENVELSQNFVPTSTEKIEKQDSENRDLANINESENCVSTNIKNMKLLSNYIPTEKINYLIQNQDENEDLVNTKESENCITTNIKCVEQLQHYVPTHAKKIENLIQNHHKSEDLVNTKESENFISASIKSVELLQNYVPRDSEKIENSIQNQHESEDLVNTKKSENVISMSIKSVELLENLKKNQDLNNRDLINMINTKESENYVSDDSEIIENVKQTEILDYENFTSNSESVIINKEKTLAVNASSNNCHISPINPELKIQNTEGDNFKPVINTNNLELVEVDAVGEKHEMLKENSDSVVNDEALTVINKVTASIIVTDNLSDSSSGCNKKSVEVIPQNKDQNKQEIVVCAENKDSVINKDVITTSSEVINKVATSIIITDNLSDPSSSCSQKSVEVIPENKDQNEQEMVVCAENKDSVINNDFITTSSEVINKAATSIIITDDLSDPSLSCSQKSIEVIPENKDQNKQELVVCAENKDSIINNDFITTSSEVINKAATLIIITDDLSDPSLSCSQKSIEVIPENKDQNKQELVVCAENKDSVINNDFITTSSEVISKAATAIIITDNLSDPSSSCSQKSVGVIPDNKDQNKQEIVACAENKHLVINNDLITTSSEVINKAATSIIISDSLSDPSSSCSKKSVEVISDKDQNKQEIVACAENKHLVINNDLITTSSDVINKVASSIIVTDKFSDPSSDSSKSIDIFPENKDRNKQEIVVCAENKDLVINNDLITTFSKDNEKVEKLEFQEQIYSVVNNVEVLGNEDASNEKLVTKLESQEHINNVLNNNKHLPSEVSFENMSDKTPKYKRIKLHSHSTNFVMNENVETSIRKCEKTKKPRRKDPKRIDFIIENLKNRNSQRQKRVTNHLPPQVFDNVIEIGTDSTTTAQCDNNMEISTPPQMFSEDKPSIPSNNIKAVDCTILIKDKCEAMDPSKILTDSSKVIDEPSNGLSESTINTALKEPSIEQEVEIENCSVNQVNEVHQTRDEENEACAIIPSSVAEMNSTIEENCLIEKEDFSELTNIRKPEIEFNETVPNEILEDVVFRKENTIISDTFVVEEVVEHGNVSLNNQNTISGNNFKGNCFTKIDDSLPELALSNENLLEQSSKSELPMNIDKSLKQKVEEEMDKNNHLLDIRPHMPSELINDDDFIQIPDSDTTFIEKLKVPSLSNDILHFKDHNNSKNYNKNENCLNIIPTSTTETMPSKKNATLHDHSVPSTSTHAINSYADHGVSQVVVEANQVPLLDADKQQPEEVIVNSSASTSCETTDNLIAVIFSNVALCNNTEVINDSERNQPNKTGFIYFRGTDHNYHSVSDPLLSGKCDNNESDHSSENSKEVPTPELENVLVDDNILPYIPTLTENNLNQELSSSLSESPVDSSTDFQLLEQCLIGNTLGRESSPPLPQACDNLYQTSLKQEVLDYDDNSSSNMEFTQQSSEVYINQFQQQTMSVENMSELMNAVLTRIQNLNNMTKSTQRYDSTSKENLYQPVQTDFNNSADNVQTTNASLVMSHNLESDCNFIPMQETNSYPESNIEYSNISFSNEISEPMSFETDFTNFYYLPVAHDTALNNTCNKKVIVERIPQFAEQQMKNFTEINNIPSVSTISTTSTATSLSPTGVKPTNSVKQVELPRSLNKTPPTTETTKSTNVLIDKIKQSDINIDPIPTSTTINVGFVRTSSRTRVSAPRPKKPSDRKSIDTRESEESGTETTDRTFNGKSDSQILKLKVRADLGITNNSIIDTTPEHKIIPAKERSLCIIEDSNRLNVNKVIEENSPKVDVRKSTTKQTKDIAEDVSKLNVKIQTKQSKEDALNLEDLNKLRQSSSSKPQKQADNTDKSQMLKNQTCTVKDAKSQTTGLIMVQNKFIGKHSQTGHSDMIDNVKRRKRKPVDYIERVDYSSIDKLLGNELEDGKLSQRTRQKKEEAEDVSPRPKKRKQDIIEDKLKLKTTCKPLEDTERTKGDAISMCNISDTELDVVGNPKTSIFEDSDDDLPLKKKSKPLEPDSMNDLFDRLVKEGNINTIKNCTTPKQNKNTTDVSTLNATFKDDIQKFNKNLLDPSHTSSARTITNNIFNLEPKKPDAVTPVKQIGVVNPIRRSSTVVRKEPPLNPRNSYGGSEESRNSSQYYPYYSDRSRRSYPYSNRESSRSSHQGSSRRIEYQPHSADQRYSSSQRSSSSTRSSRSSRHHSNSRSSTEQRNYNRYASSAANDLAWREDMKKKFPNMFKDEVYF